MEKLPQEINVIKSITYDVIQICEQIHEAYEKPFDEITIDDCLEWIEDWVGEDFGWGNTLMYQDENGNDLQ